MPVTAETNINRILGIDPGYARTGFAVLDHSRDCFKIVDYGLITTEAGTPFPERLLTIDRAIDEICLRYKPDCLAIEELFFARNTTTAIGTAQARGVAVAAAARQGLTVFEYTPLQVKVAVTGYGKAEKTQVQAMVKYLLRLKEVPKPDDVADALAICICHGHSGDRQQALAVGGYQAESMADRRREKQVEENLKS
ncbi:MAG: crossover junction endodeoxyribonuclease RuvC [Eubacteriales bacterium]|nr:crossover junction endodeoxyribonuclease RuvC [Eubacteriales bacterium]